MASFDSVGPAFDKDTPVLRTTYGKDPKARWVLWPVFAWRVVAPVPKERKLNIFQRAVLGLARAGVVRSDEIGARLLIAADLAAVISVELQQMNLLDHSGAPTKRGLMMLEDIEEEPPDEAQVGHVLSDVFTGKLWPRFLSGDLPLADVEMPGDRRPRDGRPDDGRVVLLSGSAGDPWRDPTFSILPSGREGVLMVCPSPRDVLRVARIHRRQRERDDEIINDDRDVPRLQRVSFVDERPQPYLFALRVCRHESGDWMIDDPFGHGEAIELRARLEARLDSNNGLRRWLAPLIGSDSQSPALRHLQAKAAWNVEERLTLAIRQHEVVRERLIAMQRALLEAESDDAPRDKWNDVLVKADGALMWVLRAVHQPYAATRPFFFVEFDRTPVANRNPVAAAARAIGVEGEFPPRLLSISRSQVIDFEKKHRGSLRAGVVLALLAARWNEDHPLRRALKSHPDLLVRLDDLASDRNPAAHGGAATSPLKTQRHVDTAYVTVDALLLAR